MVFAIIMMALFSAAIEYSLIRKSPRLLRTMENPKIGPMVSLGFSFALSIMLGTVFGAGGMIVMLGGIMSTVFMQPVYAMIRTGRWDDLVNGVDRAKTTWRRHKTFWFGLFRDIAKIVKLIIAIVGIPVYVVIKAIHLVAAISEFIVDPKAGMAKLRQNRS